MTPENARDVILQGAAVRAEPVTLPPTVVVPPGQLGPGSLPGTVTGADGTPVVSVGVLSAQTIKTNQIRDLDNNLMFQANGQMSLSKVAGAGQLAGQDFVYAQAGQVQGLGSLAYKAAITAPELGVGVLAVGVQYAGTIQADKITSGSFTGKEFIGGVFRGTRFVGDIIVFEKAAATVYVDTWDLFVKATSWLTIVNIETSINGPGATLSMNNVHSSGSMSAFNFQSTGTTTLGLTTVTSTGALTSNASISAAGNVTAGNDVRAPNIYSSSVLVIDGGLTGSTGSRIPLRQQAFWADLVIDGERKAVKIRLTDLTDI